MGVATGRGAAEDGSVKRSTTRHVESNAVSAGLVCHIRRPCVSYSPVSRDFSAGFGDEGEERGPRVGDRCPGPRALVVEEPDPRVPRPGRKPLLRRDGGRGLPWTRGRLGDGTGHRAPQPWRRPPPGGESYATRRPGGSPGGRRGGGRETRHTRATADGPRDGVVTRNGSGPGRSGAEMALWEDRSAMHSIAPPSQPRNHAEIAGRIRGARPNDPPRAPESGTARVPRPRGPVTESCPAAP